MAHAVRRMLLESDLVTEDQLRRIEGWYDMLDRSLVEKCYRSSLVSDDALMKILVDQGAVDASQTLVDAPPVDAALGALSRELAERHRALPLSVSPNEVVIGMLDPFDNAALKQLRAFAFLPMKTVAVKASLLFPALAKAYGVDEVTPVADATQFLTDVKPDDDKPKLERFAPGSNDSPKPAASITSTTPAPAPLASEPAANEVDITGEMSVKALADTAFPSDEDDAVDNADNADNADNGNNADNADSGDAPTEKAVAPADALATPPADDEPQANSASDVAPTPVAPTPVAPTPVAPTPVAPTPVAPTPVAPTPVAPNPDDDVLPSPLQAAPPPEETPPPVEAMDIAVPDEVDAISADVTPTEEPTPATAAIEVPTPPDPSGPQPADAKPVRSTSSEWASAAANSTFAAPVAATAPTYESVEALCSAALDQLVPPFRAAIVFRVREQSGSGLAAKGIDLDAIQPSSISIALEQPSAFRRAWEWGMVAAGSQLEPSRVESDLFSSISNGRPATFAVFPMKVKVTDQYPGVLLYVDVADGLLDEDAVSLARRVTDDIVKGLAALDSAGKLND